MKNMSYQYLDILVKNKESCKYLNDNKSVNFTSK